MGIWFADYAVYVRSVYLHGRTLFETAEENDKASTHRRRLRRC
jgi:hypothetical protein